jgi:hypothetical protein
MFENSYFYSLLLVQVMVAFSEKCTYVGMVDFGAFIYGAKLLK